MLEAAIALQAEPDLVRLVNEVRVLANQVGQFAIV